MRDNMLKKNLDTKSKCMSRRREERGNYQSSFLRFNSDIKAVSFPLTYKTSTISPVINQNEHELLLRHIVRISQVLNYLQLRHQIVIHMSGTHQRYLNRTHVHSFIVIPFTFPMEASISMPS